MRNVVILGMHRSGTSMVAGALASAGIYVGANAELLSDQDDNPNGFWERWDVVSLNDQILEAADGAWFKPPKHASIATGSGQPGIGTILAHLEKSKAADGSWLIKDPRMLMTWPCWERGLGDAVLLYVYRDPCAVALSLNRRNGFPLALGLALWQYYNQMALQVLDGRDTISVSFDSISGDPAVEISSLYSQLAVMGVACDPSQEAATFDTSLASIASANQDLVRSLLSDPQRELAAYCEALCAGCSRLPPLPLPDDNVWLHIEDMATALAPLAEILETQNELEEMSSLVLERTRERDDSLAQLSDVEAQYSALADAHRKEVDQHRELYNAHKEQLRQYGKLEQEHGKLEQEHEVLTGKAEYLFTELSTTYARLLDFEQSFLGAILRFIRRTYKVLTGRRGTRTSYDDALGDSRVHFERHGLELPQGQTGRQKPTAQPQGKLSMLGDVLKYVVRNPAGSARSFSLPRLKRATSVFLKSNPDDLDVWINSRFPKGKNNGSGGAILDPANLDEALDRLELAFPTVDKPTVSIIIPVYNSYRMTMYCLRALLKNTLDVTYEVIIADDCSTDLTASIGKRVANITSVRGEQNQGFLVNCNSAAETARGEYLLFLNNDTGVCKNWLKPLVKVFQQDEKVGIVGPKLLFGDGKLQEAGGIVWQDGSAWNFGRMDDPGKPEYNYLREVDYVSGAALLLRGKLWRQLGGFDSRYKPAYYEDTDIAFAARSAGYKVVYQPQSEIFHFEGVSHGTDLDSGLKQYQIQNQQKFLEKWQRELQSFHFPNAENVFQARDRSRHRRCVLFIDHYVPHYDKDAGSRSTFMYVQLMVEMGYKVIFLGANYFPHKPYTEALQQLGVEVLVGESMARNQDRWFKENAPYIDRIYLHRPHIAEQLLGSLEKMKPRPPIIFFGHDLHYLRISREERIVGDPALAKSAQKWKKREYAVFDRVDKIYYPSQIEVDEIHAQRPDLDVRAIPLYILEESVEADYEFESSSDILFVGGFNHPPNVDGICWFVKEVLPLVRAKRPDIKLHIVGSNPTDSVQDLQSETVVVYGYLCDEELNALYRRVRQVIVPLRFGAGVKGKVLEAIQNNLPLVTTSIGAEGIPGADQVMNIADSAEDFAASVISLDLGDSDALVKLALYGSWLGDNFSRENAANIILEDFGAPLREPI